jgi:hypothetical protein
LQIPPKEGIGGEIEEGGLLFLNVDVPHMFLICSHQVPKDAP